jgi:hypothetical protein
MTVFSIQELFDKLNYFDAKVLQLNSNYISDEIELSFDNGDTIVKCKFRGCYKSIFDHVRNYEKMRPVKEMTSAQMPYYLQNIEISLSPEADNRFFICKINMFPLYVEIWFSDIRVEEK